MVNSKGNREVLVEQYRKLGTPATNEAVDAELEKDINASAEANVVASEHKTVVQKGCREFP